MKHYIRVAKFTKYIKKELLIKILLGLCVTGTYVIQAICLAKGTALVFSRAKFQEIVLFYVSAAFLLIVRALLVRYLEGYTKQIAGKLKHRLREKIIKKLLLLGPAYQMNKRSGKLQSIITDGVEYLEPYLVNYIPQIFIVVCSVIPMVIYISFLDSTAGMILSLAVLLAVILPHAMMPFTSRASIGYWREYAVLNSQFVDTMQGMNTLKMFAAEKIKGDELHRDSESFRYRQIINTRNSLFSSAAITFMMGVATAITTGVAAYSCSDGKLEYAGLLNIMFLVIECVRPIGEMNNAWHSSYLGLSVSKEFLEIMEEPIKICEPEEPKKLNLNGKLPEIEFQHVNFRYTEKRELALQDMSFQIKKGETVAFVGASGAGKSTIVNLLLRFYDQDSGKILINGIETKDLSLEELRSNIAIVFQNTYLFYGTVMENIRMARPEATDEEVYEAARIAHAHNFIEKLEHGYDTLVGERGATLSGGQKQRIAIARAVLKNTSILVMDEATSSVDAATEEIIQETLKGLQGKYTTILIAHRLSTIQHADCIYVLNEGALYESGTHKELLQKKGIYWSLVEAQKVEGTE